MNELRDLIQEMLEAENAYGCGFYSDARWIAAYEALAAKIGWQRGELTGAWHPIQVGGEHE